MENLIPVSEHWDDKKRRHWDDRKKRYWNDNTWMTRKKHWNEGRRDYLTGKEHWDDTHNLVIPVLDTGVQ